MCRTNGPRCDTNQSARERARVNARRRVARNTAKATAALDAGDQARAVYYARLVADAAVDEMAHADPVEDAAPVAAAVVEPEDYRLNHRAPRRDDEEGTTVALSDILTGDVYPRDVLAHPDWYGGEHAETIQQAKAAAGNPEAMVTVYRAVPPGVTRINRGDWVTLSRDYAQGHSYGLVAGEGPESDGVIISAQVKASTIYSEGYLEEWGYDGETDIDVASPPPAPVSAPESTAAAPKRAPKDAYEWGVSLREKYGVDLFLAGGRDADSVVSLDEIVVPKEQRGSGVGTRVMEEIVAEADRNGWTVALTPSNAKGGSVTRLREFYRRFGFVPNKGRNKDFRTTQAYVRKPSGS